MPELPEVETARRGLEPRLLHQCIRGAVLRHRGMRWPVRADLPRLLAGHSIRSVGRRSKYLLIDCETGWLILHLGRRRASARTGAPPVSPSTYFSTNPRPDTASTPRRARLNG